MPVTKVTPGSWSGHTGVSVNQLTSGRLLAVTEDSTDAYFWQSTDNGTTWSAWPTLASITKGDGFQVAPTVQPDNTVLVVREVQSAAVGVVGTVTQSAPSFKYRKLGEDASGATVSDEGTLTAWFGFTTGWTSAARRARLLQHADGITRIVLDNGTATVGLGRPRSGTNPAQPVGGTTSDRPTEPVEWSHIGDGRTVAGGGVGRTFSRRTINAIDSMSTWAPGDSDHGSLYYITNSFDGVAFCDGENVWLYDDDRPTNSAMIRVPYSRLSDSTMDLGVSGAWKCFAHYRGKAFGVHTNGGTVRVWDTATSTLIPEENQTHTDFSAATATFRCEKYPVEEAVHIIRTTSGQAAYYRSVANTAPTRPVLTVPGVRATDASLTVTWTFSDPEGDTQQSYELRRRVGDSTTWQYWNGTTWATDESASTVIAHTTQTVTLTATQWRQGSSGEDHWFGLRVRDHPDGDQSEWSPDARVCVVAVPNPSITQIGLDATSPFNNVHPLTTTIHWTTGTQQEVRVQRFVGGTSQYDSGWVETELKQFPVTFGSDGETGELRVSVRGYGSAAVTATANYTVAIPPPPGTPTITAADYGEHKDRIRVTARWPASPAVATATVHRRKVGETGDGVIVAADLGVSNNSVTFDDWRVASGIDYEYRLAAVTVDGGTGISDWADGDDGGDTPVDPGTFTRRIAISSATTATAGIFTSSSTGASSSGDTLTVPTFSGGRRYIYVAVPLTAADITDIRQAGFSTFGAWVRQTNAITIDSVDHKVWRTHSDQSDLASGIEYVLVF